MMEEELSKTQKKREAEELQQLGIKLVELSEHLLRQFPLSERLLHAIEEAKRIKSHGAKRRQAQLIGKLMRNEDYAAISLAYDNLQTERKSQSAQFHVLEAWREKLLQGGNNALAEFVSIYQPQDIQQLRQLIRQAILEKTREKDLGASKALFRYLRQCTKEDHFDPSDDA